jgi:hypothetical protein
MMSVAIFAMIIVVALLTAVMVLVRRLGSSGQCLPVTAEWIDELSVERYRPMMRLLNSSDLEFLRCQPGYSRHLESNLRAQRCRIFQGYMRCLNMDFRRVCVALKLVMVQSRQDRPDLASILLHHQFMFVSGMIGLQVRLLLYRWGGCGVDARNLVQIFDVMRLELRGLVPSVLPASV